MPAEKIANEVVRTVGERPAAMRVRPTDLGAPQLRLGVIGEIEGYHLYWENDDGGAVERLLSEGFDFVLPTEVQITSHISPDSDIANRISRFVGKKEDGTPLRAFLLKCTNELWEERAAYRNRQADAWDADIRAGRVQADSGRYMPKGVKIDLDTKFRGS